MSDIICTSATCIILLGYRQEMWILITRNGKEKQILNYCSQERRTMQCETLVEEHFSSLVVSKSRIIVLFWHQTTLL